MPEPRPSREVKRPEHISDTWLTRQQAQAELRLRSPYALTKLLQQLQPTPDEFQIAGVVGYLSPELIERMRLEISAVEDIRDLPDHMSAMAAQAEIGCNPKMFTKLVTEFPPSVSGREVVRARNNNSEVNPAYSRDYVQSLKLHYEPRPVTANSGQQRQPSETATPTLQPSAALVDQMLERIETAPTPKLVDPNREERDALASRVTVVLDRLQTIPNRSADARLSQLWQQLASALAELKGNRPMPQGVERLLDQSARYIGRDDD